MGETTSEDSTASPTNNTAELSILKPSKATFGIDTDASRSLYDNWCTKYESDVRKWGYTVPEEVAKLLCQQYYKGSVCDGNDNDTTKTLDAGAGDGLSGQALREAGLVGRMTGIDISSNMLEVAKQRGCYDETQVVNLNQPPLPFADSVFDAVICVGTLTHLDPNAQTLSEFVRIAKPGGWICYTNRTDKMKYFEEEERSLANDGKWKQIIRPDPMPYLPNNPDYGTDIKVVVQVYQKSITKMS